MITTVAIHEGPALPELYRAHYRSLVKLASLLVDDVGTCEEIVQDAFVAVHRRGLDDLDEGKVLPYLRSAVLNGARSQLRKREVRRRLRPVPDAASTPSPERGAELSADRQQVLDALRALPDRQREVLVLRYWADLSEAEIARTLDIAPGSVKTHARRGLEALAARLEDLR
jgi:RNA polymerase sigma-70 factor (sigma-E family)